MTMCSDSSACSQAASPSPPIGQEPRNTMADRPTTAAWRRSPGSACLRSVSMIRARTLLDAVDREELGELAAPPGACCARYGAPRACPPPPTALAARASLTAPLALGNLKFKWVRSWSKWVDVIGGEHDEPPGSDGHLQCRFASLSKCICNGGGNPTVHVKRN